MDKQQMIEEINATLLREFEIDKEAIRPEALIKDDLGLDSLDSVDMLVHLQEKIKINIDPEKFQNVKTLGDIYEVIYEVIQQQK